MSVPPAYSQQFQLQPQTVILTSTSTLGPIPTKIYCDNCRMDVTTKCTYQAGLLTWLACGGLSLIGCWLCCCIPFCIDSCQDIEHHCPLCNKFFGKYVRV